VSVEEHKRASERPVRTVWRWAFVALPAAGLLELAAHFIQTCAVVPDRDWQAARGYVATQVKADDLVAFAPRWSDPIGREQFGSSLATIFREARGDDTGFPRAFEVAIRGAHVASLKGWRRTGERRFGAVTVTTLENPEPVRVVDDLVSEVNSERLRVTRVDGGRETECTFGHGPFQSGGLGFGTAVPADRFTCSAGGFVGVSIVEDQDYYPHRCVYAPPLGGNATLRLRFTDVPLGRSLHGHHTLYVEAEHANKAPVTITFSVGGQVIGQAIHRDLEGWKPFEFDTSQFAGSRADVVADIASATGERRMYCFQADTR